MRPEKLFAQALRRGLAVRFEAFVAGKRVNEVTNNLNVLFTDGADFKTHKGRRFRR